jgi:hypothetical protein
LFNPRVTFISMLAIGAIATAYTETGRVLRSIARRRAPGDDTGSAELLRMRDDGPLARAVTRALGRRGVAPPGPLRWMVPSPVRILEYGGITAIGGVAGADGAAYALLAALAYRHYDLVYRQRQRGDVPPTWADALAAGWEVRLIIAAALALLGLLPGVMFAWAAALGVAFVAESITAWRGHHEAGQTIHEEPEDAVE